MHAARRGVVDGAGEGFDERHDIPNRQQPALAQDHIERVSHRVFLGQVGGAAFDTRRDRRGYAGMTDVGRDERFEAIDERFGLIGREVGTKDLYGNEPLASVIGGLVGAKHRAQRARTNLMENPERPECLWRKVQDRIFAVQRPNGNMNSLHIPVDIRRFPGTRKLAADYAFQFSSLAPFFSGDPGSPESWRAAIANAQNHRRDRAGLSALIATQLDRRGAPGPAREAAARLADPRTVAVITGQQAGLFGGPLYTLYKGMSAVKMAARIAETYQVPTVAVFWVESEDHDWDEVSSCSVLDADFQLRVITVAPPPGAGQTPIGLLTLGDDIDAAIDRLAATLPPTEFTASILDDLRTAYRPGVTLSDAFARWIDGLLGGLGVIVFDCSDRAAKPLARRIFAHEVAHAGKTWELAREAGEQLVAAGYHAQVEAPAQTGAALFRLNGGRTPLEAGAGPGIEEEARQHPESFSPNVLLRPIVEDTLFPTVCYVSGPNELAYLAQLRKVYEHFGVPMPLFVPRASATILDSASARFLEKHDLPFEALQAQDDSALNRLLAASLPESVDLALKDADAAISGAMAAIITAVPAVDATLEGAAKSTLGRLQHDLSTLRGKVISAAKKRDDTLRRQFSRARAQAFPGGIPQERVVGSVALLNRYGPALVQRLEQDLLLDPGHHWVLTL
jgi:bacillithiol biosynthesis cysteine-adding enzyme BshC